MRCEPRARAWIFALSFVVVACAHHPAAVSEKTSRAQTLLDEHYGDSARMHEAEKLLQEVLRDAPSYAPAYVQAARMTLKQGRVVSLEFTGGTVERAEHLLLKAIELDPQLAEAHSVLGHVYILRGNLVGAEAALTEADRLGSTNPWTQVNWGHLYSKQGKHDQAQMKWIGVIEAARTATPQDRSAYLGAIEFQRNLLARAGQIALVQDLGDKATAVALPHDAWTWGNYANDLAIAGEFGEATFKARTALTKMDYGAGRYTLACALIGKWAEFSTTGLEAQGEKLFAEAQSVYPNLARFTESFCGDSERHLAAQKLLRERLERMGKL